MNQLVLNAPRYNATPIRSLAALARALDMTEAALVALADQANHLYRVAKQIVKEDGTIRITYDALPKLKKVHRKIKVALLQKIIFPKYLTGSTKGQDYKTNANIHVGAKILITEDIGSFFPSTKATVIQDVWQYFFGFSPEVAACMTKLTVRQGALPQGAITSPDLANLVFWRVEPVLQANFAACEITYSRFVDDIALSSKQPLTNGDKTSAIAKVFGMMASCSYTPKRVKHEITTARKRMVVTKLGVNDKPGLDRKKRSLIRAMVHRLEKQPTEALANFSKIAGQVALMKRFHPGEAAPLKARLDAVKATMVIETKIPCCRT
jgi:hypothetical protein